MKLVLGGGGVRSLAFVGTLEVLKRDGYLDSIDEIIGISAGCLLGLNVLLGIGTCESVKLLHKTYPFVSSELKLTNLINVFGLSRGEMLGDYIKSILKIRGIEPDITFVSLYKLFPVRFTVGTTNIVTGLGNMYSAEDDVSVVDVMMASCAIPFYYVPVKINGHLHIDGGIAWHNLPVQMMTNTDDIGINVDTTIEDSVPNSLSGYITRIAGLMSHRLIHTKAHNYDPRIIYVDSNVGNIIMNCIKDEMMQSILNSGREAGELYIKNHPKECVH